MYLGRIKLKPRYRCSNVEKLEKLINFILFFQRSDPPTSACYLISTLRHVPCDASTYKMRGSRASAKHRQVKKKKNWHAQPNCSFFFKQGGKLIRQCYIEFVKRPQILWIDGWRRHNLKVGNTTWLYVNRWSTPTDDWIYAGRWPGLNG